MNPDNDFIARVLLVIGAVAALLSVGAIAMVLSRILRSEKGPYLAEFATIIFSTGVILISLRWLFPRHHDDLTSVAYIGTAVLLAGAFLQRREHHRRRGESHGRPNSA